MSNQLVTPGDPSRNKQEAGKSRENKAENCEAASLHLSIQALRAELAVWMSKDIRGHSVTQSHPRTICLGSTFDCQCSETQVSWPRKRRRRQREIRKTRTEEDTAQHQDQYLVMHREMVGIATMCSSQPSHLLP